MAEKVSSHDSLPILIDTPRPSSDDHIGVATVHYSTWQAGYQDILPQEFLSGLSTPANVQRREEFWRTLIERRAASSIDGTTENLTSLFVARRIDSASATDGSSEIIGFASTGPERVENGTDLAAGENGSDCSTVKGEIYALYVSPEHWRRGAGKLLMDEALRRMRTSYAEDTQISVALWVLHDNVRGRQFYEKCGFTHDPSDKKSNKVEVVGGREVVELKYTRII